jgi:predicted nucleotidyltransferase
MDCAEAIARLKSHREALFGMGIEHVAVFGSTARGEARPGSDLDLAIRLRPDIRLGWDYFTLDERVAVLLGVAVDLVSEPVGRTRMQAEIDRDRVDAF